ncbi:hypothetical protein B0H14DRAFT_2574814 [Mycena olivaceomarginata]|nr:hypothetical protein B0H14DRAFT_2574814 [Mycena olivaceomarginata]
MGGHSPVVPVLPPCPVFTSTVSNQAESIIESEGPSFAYGSATVNLTLWKTGTALNGTSKLLDSRSVCARILARGTNFRSTIRTITASKVAGCYELNKPGITPSQIRAIVKQLIDNQRFILPYGDTTPRAAAADEAAGMTPADGTATTKDKSPKSFVTTLPFHAPTIVDVLHEGWWTGPKSLGVIHVKELISNCADRPTEVVLPDAMICLGAVNVWSELVCYETGHYVPVKEFSQERLEGTYLSLLNVLQEQCRLPSANYFNKTMHELYLKVSRSASTTQVRGSANNVICLPVDID